MAANTDEHGDARSKRCRNNIFHAFCRRHHVPANRVPVALAAVRGVVFCGGRLARVVSHSCRVVEPHHEMSDFITNVLGKSPTKVTRDRVCIFHQIPLERRGSVESDIERAAAERVRDGIGPRGIHGPAHGSVKRGIGNRDATCKTATAIVGVGILAHNRRHVVPWLALVVTRSDEWFDIYTCARARQKPPRLLLRARSILRQNAIPTCMAAFCLVSFSGGNGGICRIYRGAFGRIFLSFREVVFGKADNWRSPVAAANQYMPRRRKHGHPQASAHYY